MIAPVTALHAGRTRALVQRPRRKTHVASIAAGDADYLTLCGRWVPVDGTLADLRPTLETVEAHGDQFCAICGPVFAFVCFEVDRALTAAARPTRLRAVR